MYWQKGKISRVLWHITIILCVSLLCLTSIGQTTAKFVSEGHAGATASVARFSPSLVSDSNIDISGIKKPGDSTEKTFTVQNFSGDSVSEVTMKYTITLQTTGNLPLRFTICDMSEDKSVIWTCDGISGKQEYEYEDSSLVFRPGVAGERKYRLKVEWPSSQNGAQYSGLTDAVYLAAEWEQID